MPQSNPPILLTDPPAKMPEEGTEDRSELLLGFAESTKNLLIFSEAKGL